MKKFIAVIFAILVLIGCEKEADVVTTESGLKYADDSLGNGNEAKIGDIVAVHFKAWYVGDSTANPFSDWSQDSTKLDFSLGSSRDRGEPIKFPLGQNNFIRGIDEGIAGMKIGSKRTIIIPSNLAYGSSGYGPIPPNSDLKVVIELISAKEPIIVKMWDVDSTKIKTTAAGLKYIIVQEGTGEKADSGDIVTVHYTGWLRDGTKFDSSVEKDQPFTFRLGVFPVIKGWKEGISLLKEGSQARFIVPPDLGYGNVPNGKIPPNSTLIFDVELIDVK